MGKSGHLNQVAPKLEMVKAHHLGLVQLCLYPAYGVVSGNPEMRKNHPLMGLVSQMPNGRKKGNKPLAYPPITLVIEHQKR